jgi:hypothetical protein
VALHFAASLDRQRASSNNFAVWALRKEIPAELGFETSENAQLQVVEPFRESNDFLRAQRGCFSLVLNAEGFYRRHGKWPTVIDAIDADPRFAGTAANLRKFEIPSRLAPAILRRLWRMGVSHAHLMPSLQDVAKFVIQKWRMEAED